jgi:hypothetical protein
LGEWSIPPRILPIPTKLRILFHSHKIILTAHDIFGKLEAISPPSDIEFHPEQGGFENGKFTKTLGMGPGLFHDPVRSADAIRIG